MSETLYPHEVVFEYITKNIYRFDAAFSFVWAGANLCWGHGLITFSVFFILGLIFQYIDYKWRGLN